MRISLAWRMTVLSLFAAALLLPGIRWRAAAQGGAEPHAAGRRAIEQLLRDQQKAWNDGNIEKFLAGYWHSPELTFSGSGGVERGWDGVLARYKRRYATREEMGRLDFSGLEFRFLADDAALVLGRWHLSRPAKGDAGGVFTLVIERFPEGWKIIHDHTSEVPAKN